MKKWVSLSLVLMISLILVLGACAKEAPALPSTITVATWPVGSYAHTTGVAQAAIWEQYTPMKVVLIPGGKVINHAEMLKKGEITLTNSGNAYDLRLAYLAEGDYKGVVEPGFIVNWWTNKALEFGFMAAKDSGIRTIPDLRGKKVFCEWGPASPYLTKLTETILGAYGMTKNDVQALEISNATEALRLMIEGKGDALIDSLLGAKMEELARSRRGGIILPIEHTPEIVSYFSKEMPMMIPDTIDAGYPCAEVDTPIMSVMNAATASIDTNEEVVYMLLKTTIEHQDELVKAHAWNKEITLERAATLVGLPFHEGSIRYFKEMGVWTAEKERVQKELLALVK